MAFGSLGIPVVTLAGVTGLPEAALSAMTGRLCALIAIVIPAYMVVVMSGFARALEVAPPIIACSLTFAVVLFGVTNTMGPDLAVILASIAALIAMVLIMKVWQPSEIFRLEGDTEASSTRHSHTVGEVVSAWTPYMLLVAFVLAWRYRPLQDALNTVSLPIQVPLLHELILRVPPITTEALALWGALQLPVAVSRRHVMLPRRVHGGIGGRSVSGASSSVSSGRYSSSCRCPC